MTTSNFTHLVFVDFENVQKVDLEMISQPYVQVTLLIGRGGNNFGFAFVKQMQLLGPQQVQFIEVDTVGPNALDLMLASHLCRAAARLLDGNFYIVAKDTGYDSLVTHLKKQGIKASRHNVFAELPFLSAPGKKSTVPSPTPLKAAAPAKPASRIKALAPSKAKAPVDKYTNLVEQLKTGKNLPRKRAGLMRHINNVYGKHLSVAEQAAKIAQLCSDQFVTIDDKDRVTYL